MRKTFINIFSYLLIISLMVGCASKNEATPAPIAESDSNQPVLLTGTYQVTNSFVLTEYFVENAVALVDMHAFVIRDEEWEIPVESQVLGFMTFDAETLSGTFDLSLPAQPRGEFNDVDQDAVEEQGVQVFAVGYSPNLYGGPFSEGDDRSRGWPSYLASIKTDVENNNEVVGGRLVVWAKDAAQQFPVGFGEDGLLFTKDDPVGDLPQGYTVIDLDQTPFAFLQESVLDLTLYEPQDIAIKDFSADSYTVAFDKMFEIVRKEYAFTGIEGKSPDWDALYAELQPRVEQAEKDKDAEAFYLALRDFTWAFRDGHVSFDGGDYSNEDFTNATSGGYGFAIRELDDGRVITIFVVDGGPAQAAGMQVGAEILEFNGMPIYDAISEIQPYAVQSSDFAIRYQQARYLLATQPGNTADIKFVNPGGAAQTVTLTAVAERQSFSRTSVNYGVDRSSFNPVDARIINVGNDGVGYVRINSNADDLALTIRLFERALQRFEANEVAGIVIDMRYNNGGSPLGLAGFLTDQEIQMGQLEYFSEATGQFEPEGQRETVLPNQNQYRFEKMVLLVGQACYSACEIEAFGFSQVPGMIVAGQTPTGGVEAETARGNFNLPEGFSLTVPTGRFTLPDGSIFLEGQGVQPTLRVPLNEGTATASEDIVLLAGIDAVLKPLGAGVTPSGAPVVASASEAESALNDGAAFLEDIARETYEADAFSQPGEVTYTVPLPDSNPVIWGYVWCASDAATVAANFENIQLTFMLDDEQVANDSFSTLEVETGGQVCRLIFTALKDWPVGEHHLSTTATFTQKINDGTADYEPGDYILSYTVFMKP